MKLYNKKIVITGGAGMIGRELVNLLKNDNDLKILDFQSPPLEFKDLNYVCVDLRNFAQCKMELAGTDVVFHLAGTKGSPKMAQSKPSSFFVPMLQFNTNVLEAARQADVEWLLYTSSVGVYGESNKFHEDDMWKNNPSEKDWFGGWAKRMGELQLESYSKEYDWNRYSIIRPINVYGLHDNFNLETCMVVPALIQRCLNKENPLKLFGSGEEVRDFVFARDVAKAMIYCVENEINMPVNIGTGTGYKIKELLSIIMEALNYDADIEWSNQSSGDNTRIMDTGRLTQFGFTAPTSLADGIKQVIDWKLT